MASGRRPCADWTRRAFATLASGVMIGAVGGGVVLAEPPTLPVTGPPVRTLTAIGLVAVLLGIGLLVLARCCEPGPGQPVDVAPEAADADVTGAEAVAEESQSQGLNPVE